MIKILFVCHGNICRSPMAEFVMKDIVRKKGLQDCFMIASCATSTEEIGNDIHYGTRKKLKEKGITIEKRRAVQLDVKDYDAYDYLIAMDIANIKNMYRICNGDSQHKIHLLLNYVGIQRDIADPWYTGDFDKTYDDVKAGCEALLNHVMSV